MKKILSLTIATLVVTALCAQDKKEPSSSDLAKANNPLANMTALNFHNYYISKLNEAPDDMYLNTSWIRFAKPLAGGKFLLRISAPLVTTPSASLSTGSGWEMKSGLGDINAFLSYSFISNATTTVGVGPLLSVPTESEKGLGSGKWQAGFANVAFFAKSPLIQYGYLLTWQTSFAGDDNRDNTSLFAFQPFGMWQLGKGTYLRTASIWAFDLENDYYHIPFSVGIGKIVKVEKTVFNLFVEPQYSVLHSGIQPQVQIFAGINIQFIK